jgi:hypothetical protein
MSKTRTTRTTFEPGEVPVLNAWLGDTEIRSCALSLGALFGYGECKARIRNGIASYLTPVHGCMNLKSYVKVLAG